MTRLSPREASRRRRIIEASTNRQDAADRIGITPPALDEYVKRHQLRPGYKGRRDEAMDRDAWAAMAKAGARASDIAELYHVSRHTVHSALRRHRR